jgi:hypothetical protein
MYFIKKLKQGVQCLQRLSQCLLQINWVAFFRNYDKNSSIVLWIPGFSWLWRTECRVWDFGYLNALLKRNIKFHIIFGYGSAGKIQNKTIFWSPSQGMDKYRFMDYADTILFITKQMEKQHNKVIPSSGDVQLWENKAEMYERFKALNIPHPKTFIVDVKSVDSLLSELINFPYLVKEEHSKGSEGIHKVASWEALFSLVSSEDFQKKNRKLIVQELLNMRRDMRVILIDDEIVLFYWRINHKKEWYPTATKFGSTVSFKNFPEHWRDYIINMFKQLELTKGAFDIAWQNDDLTGEPCVLEVSPLFSPHPIIYLEDESEYQSYQKKLGFHKDTYQSAKVSQIFQFADKVTEKELRALSF